MYLPFRGSHTTIWLFGSKPAWEREASATERSGFHCCPTRRSRLTLEGQVVDLEALVRALRSRDDGGIADQRVVDTGVGHQVRLELVEVDVESTVEPKRRRDGADHLGDQTVQVLIARARDIQVPATDVVDGLVIDQEGAIGILDGAMRRENGVVRLDNGRRNTRGRVDGELELTLLAVLGREALEQESAEAGAGTSAEGVADVCEWTSATKQPQNTNTKKKKDQHPAETYQPPGEPCQ